MLFSGVRLFAFCVRFRFYIQPSDDDAHAVAMECVASMGGRCESSRHMLSDWSAFSAAITHVMVSYGADRPELVEALQQYVSRQAMPAVVDVRWVLDSVVAGEMRPVSNYLVIFERCDALLAGRRVYSERFLGAELCGGVPSALHDADVVIIDDPRLLSLSEIRKSAIIATSKWLQRTIQAKVLTDPRDNVLHYPISLPSLSGLSFCLTGFDSSFAFELMAVIRDMGANVCEELAADVKYLVANNTDSPLVQPALKREGISVVNLFWLELSMLRGVLQDAKEARFRVLGRIQMQRVFGALRVDAEAMARAVAHSLPDKYQMRELLPRRAKARAQRRTNLQFLQFEQFGREERAAIERTWSRPSGRARKS